jgi:hypothetical protein
MGARHRTIGTAWHRLLSAGSRVCARRVETGHAATSTPQPPFSSTAQPPFAGEGDEGILGVSAVERYERSRWTLRKLLRYLLDGERPQPIPSYTGLVEQPEEGKIGIACSGGGIRSAAFGLGALQVLQENEVLSSARYLAGVSGGSYIAAAFCMVRRTWSGASKPKPPALEWDDSDPAALTGHPPFFPGSPEEQYLRNRSSYLAPGAFGKIRLGYRLILGMGLNLLFIGLALITVAVPLGLLYGGLYPALTSHIGSDGLCRRLLVDPVTHHAAYKNTLCQLLPLHIPMTIWIPTASLAVVAIVVGAASIVAYRWRSWFVQFTEVWSLRLLLFAGLVAFLLIGLPVLLSLVRAWGTAIQSAGAHSAGGAAVPAGAVKTTDKVSGGAAVVAGAGSLATLASAVLLQLRADWAEARKLGQDVAGAEKWYVRLAPRLRRILANLIAALVGPALTLALVLGAMSFVLNLTHLWTQWAIAAGLLAFFALVYSVADMTTWSLHSFYRRRLCSAFALKRVVRAGTQDPPPIASAEAGIAVERSYHELVTLSHTAIPPRADGTRDWPTLLVCAAANISDTAATPPGRAVTSFTFSATAMGGPLVGAVRTGDLENACDRIRQSYFTLPAAVAMSGAALSPSMGKMTRWPLRFLMALANVRLGVWVPNPRQMATFDRRKRFFPNPRASYLLRELLGLNPLNGPYLYVTDGGHYENLGLVELLRRGCTEIYCFDASNDDFDAIGDAISLARSELEVEIDVKYGPLEVNPKSGLSETDCVAATITYPGKSAPPAKLYYARLALTRDAPTDAVAYHHRDPSFPHDPTSDQLYTDQRFEAYRGLGASAARTALGLSREPGVKGCLPRARRSARS